MVSDDDVQDYHSVHKAQELIIGYKFTDGCAAQYKSSHCLGDLSCCFAGYGFLVQRNFFETSHAKGEQDAAGANVKQKVSHAVLRKTTVIRNAKDMKEYLEENFITPAASMFASRSKAVGLAHRIFFYVPSEGDEAVVRCRPERTFKELKGIQKLHVSRQLLSREGSSLETTAVTALTALVVKSKTAAWMTGRRLSWKESHLLQQQGKLLGKLKLLYLTLQ